MGLVMFSKKRNNYGFNVWPGFVDALSSLLIVIVFAIIGSFVLQVYLSSILRDTDISLKELQDRFASLQKQYFAKEAEVKNLQHNLLTMQTLLKSTKEGEVKLKIQNFNLNTQISEFGSKINELTALLEKEQKDSAQRESEFENKMSAALHEKVAQLKQARLELAQLKEQIPPSILQNPELLKYRSEFFATLQDILGGRSDIRTVGDRFVFQSEVLFSIGSDELSEPGKITLDMLADVLKDISEKIPSNINWILRVDGHTDKLPIHNDRFASNWELSTSRAIRVVNYLVSKGISPKHLAAAGFAEFYPLTVEPNKMAKNRRIEIRFDSL
jgi:chemotaxis protein MotB